MMHNFHRNVETPASFTADMAITNSAPHEFDVARFVLGCDYASISAFKPVRRGDRVAPVFMVLETSAGQLVNIEINNNADYGYDVRGELVCESGAISFEAPIYSHRAACLRQTTEYAADWRPRFAEAYRRQLKAFIQFARTLEPSPIAANAWDGYCSAIVAETGVRALRDGRRIAVDTARKPAFYDR